VSQQRRGLGKGLGALIPTGPVPGSEPSANPAESVALAQVDGARFAELPVKSISPNARQPRRQFDEEALEELAASIGIVGLLQPVVVRETGPERYELIMGERRWRASQVAGLESIPAIVRETNDNDMLRDALMENLHRQQLNALEEAAAYQQLLDDFGATHEQLATRIGRSRPHISNTLRLLNLPPAVQRRVAAGVLSAGHARALLSLDNVEAQEHLAHRVVAEGLSVRTVEEIIATREAEPKESAPRRPVTRRPTEPVLRQLADRLSDRYDTKVSVDQGKRKGKIVVEFATTEDLERIIKVMAPEAADFVDPEGF
jgi:ParB family chromosome partitioning protein